MDFRRKCFRSANERLFFTNAPVGAGKNRARVCGCKQAKVRICLRPPKTRTCCFHVLWTSGGNVFVFQCVTTVGKNCHPIALNTRGRQTTRHGLFNDELHWTWSPQLHTTKIRINAFRPSTSKTKKHLPPPPKFLTVKTTETDPIPFEKAAILNRSISLHRLQEKLTHSILESKKSPQPDSASFSNLCSSAKQPALLPLRRGPFSWKVTSAPETR